MIVSVDTLLRAEEFYCLEATSKMVVQKRNGLPQHIFILHALLRDFVICIFLLALLPAGLFRLDDNTKKEQG